MERYKHAHKWLLIALILTILGFMRSYWLRFTDVSWDSHLHSLTATAWYVLVVVQPWLIAKKKLKLHRQYGMLGLILAGGVALSALNAIDNNIEAAQTSTSLIATPTFLYGVSLVDLVSILGFTFSVIMAIRKVKNLDDHAMWMISTALWAFMPAFGRLILIGMFMTGTVGDRGFIEVLFMTTPIIYIIIGIISFRMKRLHPALLLVGLGHILHFIIRPVGDSSAWRSFADALFSY